MTAATPFSWPVCPDCGLSAEVMNDFLTQRFSVGQRVQFKFHLGSCLLCSDVYHREREFLTFAAAELFPTHHAPPVQSEERFSWLEFGQLFTDGEPPKSLSECFPAEPPADRGPFTYLSDFPTAALALVTKKRVLDSLRQLAPPYRATLLLYLMGIRTYASLSEKTEQTVPLVKQYLFVGRRQLQDLVCRIEASQEPSRVSTLIDCGNGNVVGEFTIPLRLPLDLGMVTVHFEGATLVDDYATFKPSESLGLGKTTLS